VASGITRAGSLFRARTQLVISRQSNQPSLTQEGNKQINKGTITVAKRRSCLGSSSPQAAPLSYMSYIPRYFPLSLETDLKKRSILFIREYTGFKLACE